MEQAPTTARRSCDHDVRRSGNCRFARRQRPNVVPSHRRNFPELMSLQEQLQHSLGSAHTLKRELGGGGMSRVYLAEEAAFGRQVVVKLRCPLSKGGTTRLSAGWDSSDAPTSKSESTGPASRGAMRRQATREDRARRGSYRPSSAACRPGDALPATAQYRARA